MRVEGGGGKEGGGGRKVEEGGRWEYSLYWVVRV